MTVQIILTVLIIGLAAGMLSGLVGVGGGIIMVPALIFFLNYNQHQAQGTSLGVLTLPVVIIASLYYYDQCKKMGTPMDRPANNDHVYQKLFDTLSKEGWEYVGTFGGGENRGPAFALVFRRPKR